MSHTHLSEQPTAAPSQAAQALPPRATLLQRAAGLRLVWALVVSGLLWLVLAASLSAVD